MGSTNIVLVTALLALCSASDLLPSNKEVVYNYRAWARAGTHYPESYASSFTLEGKLHLQTTQNVTRIRMSDLTYKLYNGLMTPKHENEAKAIPLTAEVEDLKKPFEVVYGERGNVIGIETCKNEKDFTRNMKKAIASIFQLDGKKVLNDNGPRSFTVREKSIFGEGDMQYSVSPQKDGIMQVQKMRTTKKYDELYRNVLAMNHRPMMCDLDFKSLISRNIEMKYTIADNTIKRIQSDNIIRYKPYEGHSDSYFVTIKQIFDLEEIREVKEPMKVDDGRYENKLTYKNFDDNDSIMTSEDITNGRRKINFDKIVPQVHEMIDGIREYMRQIHINTEIPDIKKGQLINRVQRLLGYFDSQKLKELHSHLKQKNDPEHMNIYYNLLPIIGTRASALVIKEFTMNKMVDDEVATQLLKTYATTMISVPKSWLKEMEPLINLDDTYCQDVRRSAILSFATLVRKSYEYHSRLLEQQEQPLTTDIKRALQSDYDKYIQEYIQRIRSTKDYRIQSVFLDGLYNMRMHNIMKLLLPAANGEWSDSIDFRFKSLMTIATAANGNVDEVFEMLWPILSNRQEDILLRAAAYYVIMELHPGHSQMVQIQWLLKDDSNSELYQYHYSYVKSRSKTNEPCKQNIRLQFAELLDNMQPETHGLSFTTVTDYYDPIYKFSESFKAYYVNDKSIQLFGWTHSQQLNRIYQEYTFYVIINGVKENMFASDLTKMRVPNGEDVTVELVIMRNGNIAESYFFDRDNMRKFYSKIESLFKENKTISKQFFDIHYNKYSRILITTDMGIPVVFEDLQPIVQKQHFMISRENANNLINVHVDSRCQSWINYRHGLAFYNPMADVWQGVNRYHSYDSLLPIRFSLTLNPQQQSMKISWQKHEDPNKDISGVRVHVTSMVLVKDDFETGALALSSPKSKPFYRVTRGKQHQHNYPLIDKENMNTGRKLEVEVYDSHYYVALGSFQNHLMLHSWKPGHKNWESPLCYLWLSTANLMQYWRWLPEPGTYGMMIRREPNKITPVTNIDLTMRFNMETEKSDIFLPAQKLSTRLTYVIKNKEQMLKTWDITAAIDTNAGHKINNIKMEMTRMVPGQKDFKVCIDGTKKYDPREISGRWNMIMGQSTDGKCTKDTEIDITMRGTKSQEQTEERHKYEACHSPKHYWTNAPIGLQCLVAHSTVRQYEYNIKTTNVPSEFKKTTRQVMDYFKTMFYGYFTFNEEHTENMGDNNMRVNMLYPVQDNEMHVTLTTQNHQYKLGGIPTKYMKWLGFMPDSTIYSKQFLFLHDLGLIDHCVISRKGYRLNEDKTMREALPKEWTPYVSRDAKDSRHAVFVKHLEGEKMAIRLMDGEHTLEVMPKDDGYQITRDGQPSDQKKHQSDWISYKMFKWSAGERLVMIMSNLGIQVEYDGERAMVLAVHQSYGRCYGNRQSA